MSNPQKVSVTIYFKTPYRKIEFPGGVRYVNDYYALDVTMTIQERTKLSDAWTSAVNDLATAVVEIGSGELLMLRLSDILYIT